MRMVGRRTGLPEVMDSARMNPHRMMLIGKEDTDEVLPFTFRTAVCFLT